MASQVHTFEVPGSFDQVVVAAESAMRAAGVKIKHFDRQGGVGFGRTPWSWSAFGETVTIQIRPGGARRCRIDIMSEISPVFDLAGKNDKNIQAFQRALDEELRNATRSELNQQHFCIHCGTELPATAKFCGRCGRPAEADAVSG